MKVALVYDYLNQYGGGERVLQIFLEMWPKADLYTLFFDEKKLGKEIDSLRIKGMSSLNKKFIRNNHHLFIPFMPKATEMIDLEDKYDLIISITAGYAKGIKYSKGKHICYCFTPLRYAWEADNYLSGKFGRGYIIIKPILKPLIDYLKKWDRKMGQKPDKIIAISELVKNRVEKYYDRLSPIIYPPVDTKKFYNSIPYLEREYYLAGGRMVHYKGFEMIIEAFNKMGLPLVLVGRGPKLKYLKKINKSPNTKFVEDFKNDEEMREIYNRAKGLIFPQVEDFGLVALEAIACGTPIIVYEKSGAKEILVEGINGLVIKKQSSTAIIETVRDLENYNWNSLEIEDTAQKFSREIFEEKIKKMIFK